MDIEPIETSGSCDIPEAFQGGAYEGRSTLAVVKKHHRLGYHQAIGGNALA
jgi:hypothetical protein